MCQSFGKKTPHGVDGAEVWLWVKTAPFWRARALCKALDMLDQTIWF
jgi:hypothetical protein